MQTGRRTICLHTLAAQKLRTFKQCRLEGPGPLFFSLSSSLVAATVPLVCSDSVTGATEQGDWLGRTGKLSRHGSIGGNRATSREDARSVATALLWSVWSCSSVQGSQTDKAKGATGKSPLPLS